MRLCLSLTGKSSPKTVFSHRIDQGEKIFHFRIEGGSDAERLENIDLEAQQFNEKPHALNLYPASSERPALLCPFTINGARLETFLPSSEEGFYILRLFNPANRERTVSLQSRLFRQNQSILLSPMNSKPLK